MSSALDDTSAGWPGPGLPMRKPVPPIFTWKGHGSRFAYRLTASAPVLPGELARRAEVAPTPECPAWQRCREMLARAIGEPRRSGLLVADQPLVGHRLEDVRETAPADNERCRCCPVTFDGRLVRLQEQARLLAEDAAARPTVVVRPLEHAQVQHAAVDKCGGARVQIEGAAVAIDHAAHHVFE